MDRRRLVTSHSRHCSLIRDWRQDGERIDAASRALLTKGNLGQR